MFVYIIGSVSQMADIEAFAKAFKMINPSVTVRHVKKQPDKPLSELVSERFDMIDACIGVEVVTKPDGTVEEGATYEIEYAKRKGKIVRYLIPRPIPGCDCSKEE